MNHEQRAALARMMFADAVVDAMGDDVDFLMDDEEAELDGLAAVKRRPRGRPRARIDETALFAMADELGSLKKAARIMGISYSTAIRRKNALTS